MLVAQACVLTLVVLSSTCTPISKDVFSVTFPWMHVVKNTECINHQDFILPSWILLLALIPWFQQTPFKLLPCLCVWWGLHVAQPVSRSERQTFRSLPTFRRFWGLNSGPWVCVANTLPASHLASHPADLKCFYLCPSFCVCMYVHTCICSQPVCIWRSENGCRIWSSLPLSGSEGWMQIARPYGKHLYLTSYRTSSPEDFKTSWIVWDQQGMFSFLLILCYVSKLAEKNKEFGREKHFTILSAMVLKLLETICGLGLCSG